MHRVLVTGGAGFIGSFLVDKLIALGYPVRIFDNLEKQVHQGKKPAYLNKKAEFLKGDVRDYNAFKKALDGVAVVFHLASRVGVAQSNYEIKEYADVNISGTANLLDVVVNRKSNIKKIITIASMTSYGEGMYACETHGMVKPPLRDEAQLAKQDWELYCPACGKHVTPLPTNENAPLNNNSIYALTKRVQEEMLFLVGKMYELPVVSLRCFNVYGPRQSLSNPYTGVTAIFLGRLKNGKPPIIYEDGLQTRDFISVHDVVRALIAAMEEKKADFQILNIGSGKPTSIKKLALIISKLLGKRIAPKIENSFRKNDIRHCFADNSLAKKLLSWESKISLGDGFKELIAWSEKESSLDLFEKAQKELREKNLM